MLGDEGRSKRILTADIELVAMHDISRALKRLRGYTQVKQRVLFFVAERCGLGQELQFKEDGEVYLRVRRP